MEMEIKFAGGTKVDAYWQGQVVRTDQPVKDGGEGSAPEPFVHFLASIGTCAAYYVIAFCKSRDISIEGLTFKQRMEWDMEAHRLGKITFEISTPPDFPPKYRKAIIKAAERCAVARTIQNSPTIEVVTAD